MYPTVSYSVVNHQNWSQHYVSSDQSDDGLFLYLFPNCSLNLYNGGMSAFRVCPTPDAGVSRMEFDYYNLASGKIFDDYYSFVRQVANEDHHLCEKAQRNLRQGIYSTGCLNPQKESGVIRKDTPPLVATSNKLGIWY
jgi:hypothetical protein